MDGGARDRALAERAAAHHAEDRRERRASIATVGASHLGLLRDLRHARRSVARAGQLPRRPEQRRRAPHVAHEHRAHARRVSRRVRLRLRGPQRAACVWFATRSIPSRSSSATAGTFSTGTTRERSRRCFRATCRRSTAATSLPRCSCSVAAVVTLRRRAAFVRFRWTGLRDTLDLLDEAIARLGMKPEPLTDHARRAILHAEGSAEDAVEIATRLSSRLLPELETALLVALSDATGADDLAALREVRTWFEGLKHQVRSLEVDLAASDTDTLAADLIALADRADALRAGMDFRFLYDEKRKLFHIGHNATADRLDLQPLRLAGVGSAHSRATSRSSRGRSSPRTGAGSVVPSRCIGGRAALLSWGGTMFEYLMPSLFMRSQEHSLLAQSAELAVRSADRVRHRAQDAVGRVRIRIRQARCARQLPVSILRRAGHRHPPWARGRSRHRSVCVAHGRGHSPRGCALEPRRAGEAGRGWVATASTRRSTSRIRSVRPSWCARTWPTTKEWSSRRSTTS